MPKANKKKFIGKGLYGTARAAGQVMWNNRKAIAKAALNTWRKRVGSKKRRNPNQLKIMTSATGMTRTSHKIRYQMDRKAKNYKNVSNVSTLQVIDTAGFTSAQREQGAHTMCAFGIGTNGPAINGPTLIEIFNNAQTDAAGGYITGQLYSASNLNQSYKFMLQSVNQEITLTNQSQCDVNVTLYLCMSKVSNSTGTSPTADWTLGLNDTKTGILTAGAITFPGAKPWDSKEFNMKWKVVNKQRILMGAGATHIHNENVVLNRIIDMEYVDSFAQIKGITYMWMIVHQGQIASNIDNNLINVAPTEIITAVTTTWKSRLVTGAQRNVRMINNQESLQASLRVVDKISGAVEDLLVAATAVAGGPS